MFVSEFRFNSLKLRGSVAPVVCFIISEHFCLYISALEKCTRYYEMLKTARGFYKHGKSNSQLPEKIYACFAELRL